MKGALRYRIIDHTADIGLHVSGADPSELFRTCALAMFAVITDAQSLRAANTLELVVEGADWPDLLVNWLREVLFLWSGRELLVQGVDVIEINSARLRATVAVDPFDPKRHVIETEIKAVTYHQVEVNRLLTGWEAKIILDV